MGRMEGASNLFSWENGTYGSDGSYGMEAL